MTRDMFYTARARHHGEMAAYYLGELRACIAAGGIGTPDDHSAAAAIEAREAWHYAIRLTSDTVEAVLASDAAEAAEEILF